MNTNVSQLRKEGFSFNPSAQQGIVLIVGLIIVLLISIVALAAIRGSGLQEAISGNMRDRNIAFQAAETGLLDGEAIVDINLVPVSPSPNPAIALHDDLNVIPANSVASFDDAAFIANGKLTEHDLDVESQPIYIVEQLAIFRDSASQQDSGGTGSDISKYRPYRVTAKGVGLTPESQVILQSTYNRFAQ